MRRFRGTLLCLIGSIGLVATACIPPTEPTNQAPVAVVAATPDSGDAPLQVTFSPDGSSDGDGTIVSYEWDFGDGSLPETLTTPDEVSHVYGFEGAYTATLTLTDNGGATGSTTVQITVGAPNSPPTAVIAADPTSGKEPLTVQFTGSSSSDVDGTVESYEWDFGDGSATSSDADPSHLYDAAGLYTAQLTVTDDDGATGTETVNITVDANQPPTAVAAADPTQGKFPLTVQFTGSGSSDPDGTIESYEWDFGDGSATSSDADPSHLYTTPGTYTASLTVTDDNGQSGSDTVDVVVDANQPPTAVANANPTSGQAPLTVNFSSSASTDVDGTIVSHAWDFGDGNGSTAANPTYTYSVAGSYTAVLTVTDDNGDTDTDQVTIEVSPIPNEAPTAVGAGSPLSGKEPLTVGFSSAGSTDPEGGPLTYAWDFGDGGSSTQANPSHTFTAAGTYVVTLTVKDTANATGSTTVSIEVVANQAPEAFADASPFTVKEGGSVQFFSAGSNDPDGTLVSYLWDFGDGETSSAANPSHVYDAPGTFQVSLTVTDDNGATATDQDGIVITVTANQAPVAALNATPQNGARPLVVAFSSASSADPDGNIVSRSWDFGDGGPTSSAANPSYTYTQAGTFTATLTVTDDNGETDTDEVEIVVVVDDDGDGVSPPADCDDDAAGTYPGAPDALGDNVDSNCDGGDGVVAEIIHVRSGGGTDTTTCGSIGDPCASITFGLTRAQATNREAVVVAGGTYARFRVRDGIDVRGGFGQNFLRGGSATGSTTTTVNGSYDADYGASAGVIASGIGEPTLVSDLRVVGANESANARASYGVIVASSTSALTLDTLTVIGGVGGDGSAGNNGASATQSAAPGGSNGEDGDDPVTACSTSRKSGGSGASGAGNGGQGGSQDSNCNIFNLNYNATNGIGGTNAATTGSGCGGAGGGGQANTTSSARDGGNGQSGCVSDGGPGSAGIASNGAVSGGLWTRSGGTGGLGSLGANGGGGGGGGGGGANDDGINADDRGGGGGGGGQGGVRAPAAGTGGAAGHGSIAVLVTGSQANLVNFDVTLGTGGAGGQGGSGGLGQPGGPGGSGGARRDVGGQGGDGGAGGRGGHAGGGGGGAGGPSFGIVTTGSSPTISATTFTGGAGGAGGAGGTTGVAGSPGQSGPKVNVINL